jgi:hypothetical protein
VDLLVQLGDDYYVKQFQTAEETTEEAVKEVTVSACMQSLVVLCARMHAHVSEVVIRL